MLFCYSQSATVYCTDCEVCTWELERCEKDFKLVLLQTHFVNFKTRRGCTSPEKQCLIYRWCRSGRPRSSSSSCPWSPLPTASIDIAYLLVSTVITDRSHLCRFVCYILLTSCSHLGSRHFIYSTENMKCLNLSVGESDIKVAYDTFLRSHLCIFLSSSLMAWSDLESRYSVYPIKGPKVFARVCACVKSCD